MSVNCEVRTELTGPGTGPICVTISAADSQYNNTANSPQEVGQELRNIFPFI